MDVQFSSMVYLWIEILFTVDKCTVLKTLLFHFRVLKIISKESIRLTLKPILVESQHCLTDYSLALPGKQFPGTVVLCTPAGVLVAFYGKIKGWVPTSHLLPNTHNGQIDPKTLFFIGQVVIILCMHFGNISEF